MENRKKNCLNCMGYDEDDGCICAEECINFDQYCFDEEIIIKEHKETLKIITEIYNEAGGPWGDPVICEKLYNRMGKIIEANV